MTVFILRSNSCQLRKNKMPLKAYLSKMFSWRFDRILVIRWVMHCKRKNCFCNFFIVIPLFSIYLEEWENRALIKDKKVFAICTYLKIKKLGPRECPCDACIWVLGNAHVMLQSCVYSFGESFLGFPLVCVKLWIVNWFRNFIWL